MLKLLSLKFSNEIDFSPKFRLSIQCLTRSLIEMAEEELVDPKQYLEDRCKPKCVKSLYDYQACVKRVEKDETDHKHCTGQYFDYWFCVDKCVAVKLFESLK
ncbi:hypothetical protein LUZ60_007480 [Juncus effusus]|nr:hypothetical protein LUZ60_007480 [Juncus effusus]